MEKFKDFKKFELKLEKVLQKGKRFNLIDRFYYYSIKERQIKNQILKLNLTEDEYHEFVSLIFIDFGSREHELKSAIIESYGLSGIKAYSDTKKATILSNPNLLGISPFLFRINTNEWYDYLKNDIAKYKNFNIYHIQQIILNCLNDSLGRLDLKHFETRNIHTRKVENLSSDDLFYLLVDDIFEVIENSGLNENAEKGKEKFIESLKLKSLIKDKLEINLPFEKADKVLKKYFEINFKEKYNEIYPGFRIFLKVLCNEVSMETEIKSINLTNEEVKKMIGFFSYFKTRTLPNIFTYGIKQLIELMEHISGLQANTTWDKAHRTDEYYLDRNSFSKINSVLPDEMQKKYVIFSERNP
ncbi:TPA: hypothetical protein ACGFUY_001940 [Flavobacterium psychrophilum]